MMFCFNKDPAVAGQDALRAAGSDLALLFLSQEAQDSRRFVLQVSVGCPAVVSASIIRDWFSASL